MSSTRIERYLEQQRILAGELVYVAPDSVPVNEPQEITQIVPQDSIVPDRKSVV